MESKDKIHYLDCCVIGRLPGITCMGSGHEGAGSGGPLYSMGHGQVITAEGTRISVDLFSDLSNDTVITSPGRNFEVSSGAQMQLLVGVSGH